MDNNALDKTSPGMSMPSTQDSGFTTTQLENHDALPKGTDKTDVKEKQMAKKSWFTYFETIAVGLFPILIYIGISLMIAESIKKEQGGWNVFLYMIVPPVSIACIAALAFQISSKKIKVLPIIFIVINVILFVMCSLCFQGHPEYVLFWAN